MLVGLKPKPAGQAHEKMTQRTAHHILRCEILWIHVDEENGKKGGVQLYGLLHLCVPQYAEIAEVYVYSPFKLFSRTDQTLSSVDSER